MLRGQLRHRAPAARCGGRTAGRLRDEAAGARADRGAAPWRAGRRIAPDAEAHRADRPVPDGDDARPAGFGQDHARIARVAGHDSGCATGHRLKMRLRF